MGKPSTSTTSGISPFGQSVSQFSNKFLQTVTSSVNKDENLICSPLSCLITLAMAQAGATGSTLENMTEALCLPKDLKETHKGFAELVANLKLLQADEKDDKSKSDCSDDDDDEESEGQVDLTLSNRVYLKDKNLKIKEDYLATLEKTFNASAHAVDFLDPATVVSINNWVETQTKNKIKDICNSGSFDKDTTVVLINTIYFKCDWLIKFNKANTDIDTFYLDETKTVKVPFMFAFKDFPFAKLPELDSQLLQLHYEHEDFSFVIILPNEKTGLAALESKLATKDLATLLQQVEFQRVEVSLPKFQIETTLDLISDLKKMGIENAFDKHCTDFTGVTDTTPMFISDVIQKAFIEVNEEGTVAAAATMVSNKKGSAPCKEIFEFNCDHPFAFYIVYKEEYTLFAGSLKSPAEETEPPSKRKHRN